MEKLKQEIEEGWSNKEVSKTWKRKSSEETWRKTSQRGISNDKDSDEDDEDESDHEIEQVGMKKVCSKSSSVIIRAMATLYSEFAFVWDRKDV